MTRSRRCAVRRPKFRVELHTSPRDAPLNGHLLERLKAPHVDSCGIFIV